MTPRRRPTFRRRVLGLVALLLSPVAWPDTVVVPAGGARVTDVSRFAAGVTVPDSVTDVGEVATHLATLGEHPDLCGMRVVARATAAGGTPARWDLLFSVVTDGERRIGGITAGAFAAGRDGRRWPIVRAAITPAGGTTPTEARAAPSGDGFVGVLADALVLQVWEALDVGTELAVDVTYASGLRQTIRFRTLGSSAPGWYRGRNSPSRLCLRVLAPASRPSGPLREMQRSWPVAPK